MKKSVFELTRKEGKKVDKRLRKTSYFRQYLLEFALTIMILAFVIGFLLGYVDANESIDSNLLEMFNALIIIIGFGFIAVVSILFAFKRFDLVKKYYEEVYVKKEK